MDSSERRIWPHGHLRAFQGFPKLCVAVRRLALHGEGTGFKRMTSSDSGKADQARPAEIGHDEFVALQRDGGAAIVDVREPHEFVAGHVPGAVNLPLSRFDPAE